MLINESLDAIMSRSEFIVSDWDNVIQHIDLTWVTGVLDDEAAFAPFFNMGLIKTTKCLQNLLDRKEYYINNWLQEGKPAPDEVTQLFMAIYLGDPLFYHRCPFTNMARCLKGLAQQNFTKEIVFLSHVPFENGEDIRKEEMMRRFFGRSSKFRMVTINSKMEKWDWIAQNLPHYTTFIDDRSDIVQAVIENTDSATKNFLIPSFGYNTAIESDMEFLKKCERNNSIIQKYQMKLRLRPL